MAKLLISMALIGDDIQIEQGECHTVVKTNKGSYELPIMEFVPCPTDTKRPILQQCTEWTNDLLEAMYKEFVKNDLT